MPISAIARESPLINLAWVGFEQSIHSNKHCRIPLPIIVIYHLEDMFVYDEIKFYFNVVTTETTSNTLHDMYYDISHTEYEINAKDQCK